MNYLAIVNKVLIRLRESEVTSVQDNPYSKLIGEFVNVVKREVEDAHNWSALRTDLTINTVASTFSYSLPNSSIRTRLLDVENSTLPNKYEVLYQTRQWFDEAFRNDPPNTDRPFYYNITGIDANDRLTVKLYPVPDAVYTLNFSVVNPQVDLVNDGDILHIPYQVVIEGAVSRAISERGDDGGYTEQEARYTRVASDYIAIDSGYRPEESIWYPV
jgi:hypothetical protein